MSLNPRQGDKRFNVKPVLQSPALSHNMYPDLKNKWASNALDFDYSISDILCFFVVVFLFGWLCSQLIMFAFIVAPEPPLDVEILEPHYSTKIEHIFENIDYAAVKSGGKIIKELSSPEMHGIGSHFTSNILDALISEENSINSCWPIQGNYGFAAIELSLEIYPTGFSIVLPKKFMETMPKEVSVYSLDTDSCYELARVHIEVDPKGGKMKSEVFSPCMTNCLIPTKVLLVEINENYGALFTCMYQFKAHGNPTK